MERATIPSTLSHLANSETLVGLHALTGKSFLLAFERAGTLSSRMVYSYSPSPYGSYPPDCVCSKPYTVCNGKCGLYKACPSSYGKRALSESSGKLLCPIGLSACQIIGRGTESWECVDTKQDLESCENKSILTYCFEIYHQE